MSSLAVLGKEKVFSFNLSENFTLEKINNHSYT